MCNFKNYQFLNKFQWWSDNDFGRKLIKHGIFHSKFAPVYFYHFSFVGTRSLTNPIIPGKHNIINNVFLNLGQKKKTKKIYAGGMFNLFKPPKIYFA